MKSSGRSETFFLSFPFSIVYGVKSAYPDIVFLVEVVEKSYWQVHQLDDSMFQK